MFNKDLKYQQNYMFLYLIVAFIRYIDTYYLHLIYNYNAFNII